MRNLIKKILKEEQEWFDEIEPINVYLPWVEDGIKGLEEWEGQAYQSDDEIGEAIVNLKLNPTKEAVKYTIKTIQKWKGQAYVEGDDFDWALDYLKMSIDPYSWKRFNVFDSNSKMVRGYSHKEYQNEALKDTYITNESYSCLVTEDEEWILLRKSMGTKPTPIPTLLKTENLDVNSLSSCYLINETMLESNWRNFRRAEKVFLKDVMGGPSTTANNNFNLKVVKFKDGMVLDRPHDTDSFFQ